MSPSSPERAASSPRPCFLGLTVKDPGHLAGDTSPPLCQSPLGRAWPRGTQNPCVGRPATIPAPGPCCGPEMTPLLAAAQSLAGESGSRLSLSPNTSSRYARVMRDTDKQAAAVGSVTRAHTHVPGSARERVLGPSLLARAPLLDGPRTSDRPTHTIKTPSSDGGRHTLAWNRGSQGALPVPAPPGAGRLPTAEAGPRATRLSPEPEALARMGSACRAVTTSTRAGLTPTPGS